MKLQSMTDRVLELANNLNTINGGYIEFSDKAINYANFLKQPLTLSMFIPTDENGNVLEEPIYEEHCNCDELDNYDNLVIQYQQAKDRVIFEGFELDYDSIVKNSEIRIWFYKDLVYLNSTIIQLKTIEDLIEYNLTITETAVKKYGL